MSGEGFHVLVTGATGFLGSHLIRALRAAGHEVSILKRSSSDCSRIAPLLSELAVFDLDRDRVEAPFRQRRRIDAIIHAATLYGRQNERSGELLEANVAFPLNLLEIGLLHGTPLFINTDSFIHKGAGDYAYLQSYTLTKKQFVEWGRLLSGGQPIRFVNVRLEHLYGPFDSGTKFASQVIRACLNNEPELRLTAGEQRRDFIYVEDAVQAYIRLLQPAAGAGFAEYELGTGRSMTIRTFVELVKEETRSKTVLNFGALPYRSNEIMQSEADIGPLQSLGWSWSFDVRAGIRHLLELEYGRCHP